MLTSGRSTIRFAIDDCGELYIISKSDGMIRGLTAPPQRDASLAGHFDESERAIPEIAGDLADPDDDGVLNLLEYALGLNPRENSAAAMPPGGRVRAECTGTDAAAVFPRLSVRLRFQ
ncbi:MAG: hypothetical protein JJT96_18005 [Opitutales bacterium]|nr:hypothetical protein [Opitutales bacterium]